MNGRLRDLTIRGLRAAIPAAVLSGFPSTVHALLTRRDPLASSTAAGSMVLRNEARQWVLVLAAVPVHLALSAAWATAMAAVLPLRRPMVEGTLAGLAIATLDLGVVGRRYPRIRELQLLPQLADHVAFGVITSIALRERS